MGGASPEPTTADSRDPETNIDVLFVAANTRSLAVNRRPIIVALHALGLRVGALVPDDEFVSDVHALGVQTWAYSLERHATGLSGEVRRFFRLRRLIARIAPRVVMAYSAKPVIIGVPAARLAGVREVYSLATGLGYVFSRWDRRTLLIRQAVVYGYALAGWLSNTFFFQNPDDRDELRSNWLFRRFVRTAVVPGSGVDLAEFQFTWAPVEPVTFLFMGRLLEEKGIRDFVEAARKVRSTCQSARFVALGERDASLLNAVSEDQLDCWVREGVVEFPGRVRDVRTFLARASVVVLPSYYREGVPRALLEALSTGRAILTCDTPGCRETVEDGVNGWKVPPRSPDILAERMRRFLADPTLVVDMGRRSRAIAEARFADHIISSEMLAQMEIARTANRMHGT